MLERIQAEPTDRLLVGTADGKFLTLRWNAETGELEAEEDMADINDSSGLQNSMTTNICTVDPSGRHFCLSLYEGTLTFLRCKAPGSRKLDEGFFSQPEQRRITELAVVATTFLNANQNAKLAILYQSHDMQPRLAIYKAYERSQYSFFDPSQDKTATVDIDDAGPTLLIPVPPADYGAEDEEGMDEEDDESEKSEGDNVRKRKRSSINPGQSSSKKHSKVGGVIVVGQKSMTYFDDDTSTARRYEQREPNSWVAYTAIDHLRYLLADEFGGLHLLSVIRKADAVSNIVVRRMGTISTPTSMVYMDGYVFVASHVGNSQFLKLDLSGPRAPTFKIVHTILNIAPIIDFTIMDLGNRTALAQTNEFSSGQARIVAGCGAFETGSLQSIRSGVGLEEIGSLGDLGHVKSLHTLQNSGSGMDNALLVSLLNETRVFLFGDESDPEIEEVEDFKSFNLSESTLLAVSVPGGKLLQVCPSGAILVDAESGMQISVWKPEGEITAVASNGSVMLVSVDGKVLVSVGIGNDLTELARKNYGESDQIACLHVSRTAGPSIGVVGLWRSRSVIITNLSTLEEIQKESIVTEDAAAVPRDAVVAQLLPPDKSGPTLLVAMSDGIIVSFTMDLKAHTLSDKKYVALGTQQADLSLAPTMDGLHQVFATCEMASLIRGVEGHIVYSAVTIEGAQVVAAFNTAAFPDALMISTGDDVRICAVFDQTLTHTKPLPLGQTVRRLVYSEGERVFGLAMVDRQVIDGAEYIASEFRLVDEFTFAVLGKPYQFGYLSQSTELVEAIVTGELSLTYGEPQERFVVGTSLIGGPTSGHNGRILVFGIDQRKSPYLIAERQLKGACKCLGIVDGKIVAALTKTVVILDYEETGMTSGTLTISASYRMATAPIDMTVKGNVIAVTDLMKSVSLLEYKRGEKGMNLTLTEVARDHEAAWGTAVGHVEDQTWLGADGSLNLKVLRQKTVAATEEDKKALENIGEYHLGENVNRIRSFSVNASSSAIVVPKAFLATVSILLLFAPTSN